MTYEIWLIRVQDILELIYEFTDEQVEKLLYGDWSNVFYEMWDNGYSPEKASKIIADEKKPWNIE